MPSINAFRDDFFQWTIDWSWEIEGFLDKEGNVHPIDSDTKVISTVFERLASPVVRSIAKSYKYTVELANQTTYPDFTLTNKDTKHRVALDVKTTYHSDRMLFTLGGYKSFLRNNTKNILYPYNTYHEHWILGFIYEKKDPFPEYDLDGMPSPGDIWCPYTIVAVFIREKHEITGLRAGSGNTKNIGSVKVDNARSFANIKGPFTAFAAGKAACDHYWKNYERYKDEIETPADLVNHMDFQQFRIIDGR